MIAFAELPHPCGTSSGWRHGCRCAECRTAHAAEVVRYRERLARSGRRLGEAPSAPRPGLSGTRSGTDTPTAPPSLEVTPAASPSESPSSAWALAVVGGSSLSSCWPLPSDAAGHRSKSVHASQVHRLCRQLSRQPRLARADHRANRRDSDLNLVVGETGLEPATPSPPDWCANHLRYSPRSGVEHIRR